jgi:hypothetical protein
MAKQNEDGALSDAQRKAIFLALVEAQDGAIGVAESRTVIAKQFSISEGQIRKIEQEGLKDCWPPLD